MKLLTGTALAMVLLLGGFAAGIPVGKSEGFEQGCEWALVQADIVARESGVFMPVYLDNGTFKVVMRQPRGLYKRAWKLADLDDEKKQGGARQRKAEARPLVDDPGESIAVNTPASDQQPESGAEMQVSRL